ncbi:MAG TPA: hypothetical protein VG841_02810 [Caulobacterales bacterium]|nr:hypothetical protein [Caulobacterales bacterium]
MRKLISALALGACVYASAASADPWTSPDAKITFDKPAGWLVQPQPADGFTYILTGAGNAQCDLMSSPRPATTDTGADLIREAGKVAIAPEAWSSIVGVVPDIFGGAQATLVSHSVNTDAFWPVNLADFNANGRVIHAAIQFRPGVELWAFCQSNSGADDAATYSALLRSVGLPNDAELQATAVQLAQQRETQRNMAQNQRNQAARQSVGQSLDDMNTRSAIENLPH